MATTTVPGAPVPMRFVVSESGELRPSWATDEELEIDPAQMAAYCRATMQTGSLSFFLASRLLAVRLRSAVRILYTWCRYCDDVTDRPEAEVSVLQRSLALDELRRRTWAVMQPKAAFFARKPALPLVAAAGSQEGEAEAAASAQRDQVFAAFAYLVRSFAIPDVYPQELLSGMEMDLKGQTYPDLATLRLYAYRVAGTVGLMFSHLAGVSDERALRHAADLGIAMQLTNIARDVQADFALGRVYLPSDWLAEVGLTPEQVGDPARREQVARVVARLLTVADELYQSGEAGLVYLPVGAAFAVAAARLIYAEIGKLVRARGAHAWTQRAVVPLSRKLLLLVRAVRLVLSTWPQRPRPWRSVPIRSLWRFT